MAVRAPAAVVVALVSLTALVTLVGAQSSAPAETWSGEAALAADGSVRMQWRIHDGNFTCRIEAKTRGWVGFGLSPNGGMHNSDMIVAGVREGRPYLMDMHTRDSYQLIPDQRQVTHLMSAQETSTSTVVTFTRPLEPSCLPGAARGENRDITEDTQHVLYAYHNKDPELGEQPLKHEQRGQRSIHLRDPAAGQPPSPPLPSDAAAPQLVTWTVTQQRAQLPAEDTVYWCTVARAPPLTSKHHVIKYRPLIELGHERIVHHMLVYQCSGHDFTGLGKHVDSNIGGYRCYSANMPPEARGCRGVIAGWGVGGEDFEYPEHVGYPMGPDHGAEFYILETHYDLQGMTDVEDSSGLEFTLTPRPRQQDASMLIVGHDITPLQLIPPLQSGVTVAGHCSDECLQLALPEDGVTVFAALPHTHLLGRQIRLRHFRGGDEVLPSIVRDDNYDFNYQQLRHVAPRRVLRGDQLTVECVYRSRDRERATLGGRSTEEEMCVTFVLYYPAIQLAQCVSSPMPAPVLAALGINEVRADGHHNLVVASPAEFDGLSLRKYVDGLNWTSSRLDALDKAALQDPQLPECYEFGRHVLKTVRILCVFALARVARDGCKAQLGAVADSVVTGLDERGAVCVMNVGGTKRQRVAYDGFSIPNTVTGQTTRNTTGYTPGISSQGWLNREETCPYIASGVSQALPDALVVLWMLLSAAVVAS